MFLVDTNLYWKYELGICKSFLFSAKLKTKKHPTIFY